MGRERKKREMHTLEKINNYEKLQSREVEDQNRGTEEGGTEAAGLVQQ